MQPQGTTTPRPITMVEVLPKTPVVACWGGGIDSTAMLVELDAQGNPPDLVLYAQTGSEHPETDAYVPIFARWLADRNIEFRQVRYQPKRLNGKPGYESLLEDLLASQTLPAIAFGQHSCSLKWKVAPQTAEIANWEPAQAAWARGIPVTRLIGYDASPRDIRRHDHSLKYSDPRFQNRFPLIEWQWTRDDCRERILRSDLPLPRKSSCFFCTACRPHEIDNLPDDYLKLIVLIEAAAAPKLTTTEGLWRKTTKGIRAPAKPGKISTYIEKTGLLTPEAISAVKTTLLDDLQRHLDQKTRSMPSMRDWLQSHFPSLRRQVKNLSISLSDAPSLKADEPCSGS